MAMNCVWTDDEKWVIVRCKETCAGGVLAIVEAVLCEQTDRQTGCWQANRQKHEQMAGVNTGSQTKKTKRI